MALNLCMFIDHWASASSPVERQVRALRARGHRVVVVDGAPGPAPATESGDTLFHVCDEIGTWGRKTLGAAALFMHRIHRERQPGQRRMREIFTTVPHHGPYGLRDAMALAGRTKGGPPLRFDVILAHGGPVGVRAGRLIEAGLLAGALAVVFDGPDLSSRDVLRDFGPSYRHLFALADQLLPVTELGRKRLIELGARPTQVEVLHNGVPVPLPSTEHYRPIARDRPLNVLTIAPLTEHKGIAYALEGLIASGMRVRYAIIGDGPLRPTLEVLARRAGPSCEVAFLGPSDPAGMRDELARADVLLMPSVTPANGDQEGLPAALLDAMAAGVLVVATEHGALPELVIDGETGLLVPERDTVAIAELFRRIAGSGLGFEAMRDAALRKVRAQYNAEVLDLALEAICVRLASAERAVA